MVSLQSIFRPVQFFSVYFREAICLNKKVRMLYPAAFLFLITFLISCGNSDKELNEYSSKSLGIEEIINADINYTLGGNAKAKLLSPLMLRVQDASPYVEFPKKLHVDFFNETGTVDSRLDAKYGKYFESESTGRATPDATMR